MSRASSLSACPRVAWFSPLSGGERKAHGWSPAAYVTRRLIPELVTRAHVTIFHDEFKVPQWCRDIQSSPDTGLEVRHFLTAADCDREKPFDVFLYHLENHRRTGFSRIHLGLKPGVVWFHDFLLTDDGPEPILNSPWERTVARFFDRATPWPEPLEEFTRPRPHAVREASVGGLPIFSSERDVSEFQRLKLRTLVGGATPIGANRDQKIGDQASGNGRASAFLIPYPVESKVFELQAQERATAGSPTFTLGWCGSPSIEQRFAVMCEALSHARVPGVNIFAKWMLPQRGDKVAAAALLQEFGVQEQVTLLYGDSFDDWVSLLPTIDCATHLRFSAFGQAGPALALSMAAGVAVVVSDFGASEHIPSEIAFKIQPGATEVLELAALWQALAQRAVSSWNLSNHRERVRAYARERHEVRVVVSNFMHAFEQSQPALARLRAGWDLLEGDASETLLQQVGIENVSTTKVSGLPWYEDEVSQWLGPASSDLGWQRP